MKKVIYFLVTSLTLIVLALFSIPQITAKADSVNVTAIQPNGSTSMADAYLVKPATVNVSNDQYEVTYTIRTNKDLGTYPVKILSMNVQTTGISNKEDSNAYYTSITFKSNQLDNITGTMKVDVDSANIHQTHPFGLKFSNPPKLNAASDQNSADTADQTDNNANTADTNNDNAQTDVSENVVDPLKQSDKKNKKADKKTKKKTPNKNKQEKKSAKKADKSDNKKSNVPKISAGVTLIAVVIGGGFFVKKRFF
ncbi:NEAT domain-containing protein [Companilactobacillus baiquanensis]|uniref:NEAT domain-containing protein n=1 Tax=Companilactobacillus baiquanensis TaxID=2486005 RepID=A0ABW1UXN9_9LACO|nr:NEAT domain-containing protein [Companilactobacillus baiquanensis]